MCTKERITKIHIYIGGMYIYLGYNAACYYRPPTYLNNEGNPIYICMYYEEHKKENDSKKNNDYLLVENDQ